MNLQTLSETELKALAYDQLQLLEQTRNNINVINQELAQRRAKASQELLAKKPEGKVGLNRAALKGAADKVGP